MDDVNKTVEFQEYMVLMLDLLGQGQRLRQLTGIPQTEQEKMEFVSVVRETFGYVETLRDCFKTYFEGCSQESDFAKSLPEDARAKIRSLAESRVLVHAFSDSLIVSVPLKSIDENSTPTNSVRAAMVAAAGISLFHLSVGRPLRGGLDVGVGTQMQSGEVYGAGLERAHHLESKLAEYPRILVGRTLIDYLRWIESLDVKTNFGRNAKANADLCRRMLLVDPSDGRVMLDFLGDSFREAVDGRVERKVLDDAYTFVRDQQLTCARNGNDLMAARYFRLRSYFERRLPAWKG